MTQYINKAALVAEIERRRKINKQCMLGLKNLDYYQGKVDALSDTISFLDTLEVKEVDLEKEINDYFDKQPIVASGNGMKYRLVPSAEKNSPSFL